MRSARSWSRSSMCGTISRRKTRTAPAPHRPWPRGALRPDRLPPGLSSAVGRGRNCWGPRRGFFSAPSGSRVSAASWETLSRHWRRCGPPKSRISRRPSPRGASPPPTPARPGNPSGRPWRRGASSWGRRLRCWLDAAARRMPVSRARCSLRSSNRTAARRLSKRTECASSRRQTTSWRGCRMIWNGPGAWGPHTRFSR
jgi:hypothetical protein